MANSNAEQTERPFLIGLNLQTALDALFVIALPVACLVLDPGIIAVGPLAPELALAMSGPGLLSAFQLPLYLLIVLLISGFWLSFLENLPEILSSALRGVVILGMVLSGLFALMMFPLIVLAAIAVPLLAPFGFAPVLTGWRYYRRYRDMGKHATKSQKSGVRVFAGIVAPVAAVAILYIGSEQVLRGPFQDLHSGGP